MARRLPLAFTLALCAVAAPCFAAKPLIEVTTCGQVIPRGAIGYLTADLDCTGFDAVPGAVLLSRNATFELRGFTVTGGQFTVLCGEMENGLLGPGTNCTVRGGGGTVRQATSHGVIASQLKIYDLHIEDADEEGIHTDKKATLENVTVTGSGGQGVRIDGPATVRSSTITGSAEEGIAGQKTVRVIDSVVRGNGTGPQCPAAFNCADIRAPKRPSVVRSDCGTSRGAGATSYNSWFVCMDDFN